MPRTPPPTWQTKLALGPPPRKIFLDPRMEVYGVILFFSLWRYIIILNNEKHETWVKRDVLWKFMCRPELHGLYIRHQSGTNFKRCRDIQAKSAD